nr:sugar-binding domain-containing protein [uncultured Carboxylicivirga sp.]
MKRSSYLLLNSFLLAFVLWGCQMGETQQKLIKDQNFDFDWRFALGDYPEASQAHFNDDGWRSLNLPHDWSIEGQRSAEAPTGNDGGYFPSGIGWYRKSFKVPALWKGQKVRIYFEGVYMNAEVFVNGHSLGVHPYGYTSFYYDITPYLVYGKGNTIAVKVDNSPQKNCRWYSGSGIYRHVRLDVTAPICIDKWGVGITTLEVSSEKASVEVKTIIKNDFDTAQKIMLQTLLQDKHKNDCGKDEIVVELAPNSLKEVIQNIEVQSPDLWSPELPDMYNAISKVYMGEVLADKDYNQFGIRTINYSVEKGFELNGNTIKLNGGCVHHDNGVLGAAAYDRAEERKVELLKSAGYNAVRTSHNPPSEAFLSACDRLGLLVIDESFDGWKVEKTPHDYASVFDDWWEKDIYSMVMRDRNHPSIIMWSSGNEIIERTEPEAVESARMLNSYIRELDSSRPVTSAMTSWNQGWKIFDPLMAEHDICGYNYMMHEAESDHERVPKRIIFQSESYPKDAFYNWDMVHSHDYIIGDFVWTAMDYLGESSIGRYFYPGEPDGQHFQRDFYPWHGAYCGDIDLIGHRKPISHYRNILWNESEKLYLAVREPNPSEGPIQTTMWAVWPTWERWTWPGFEDKEIDVEVYSKYPIVRLYLNEKLVGEKITGQQQEYKATFAVKYVPGILKAVGVEEGKEKENCLIQTSNEASQIRLVADRSSIKADGQDLSFVTVEILDNKGVLVSNAEAALHFSIQGEGEIVGIGNANLKDEEVYVGNSCSAWNGRALVVLKSTRKSGDVVLTISSEGLVDATVLVKTE